jgi:MYXO-CTERM domain-containing protein
MLGASTASLLTVSVVSTPTDAQQPTTQQSQPSTQAQDPSSQPGAQQRPAPSTPPQTGAQRSEPAARVQARGSESQDDASGNWGWLGLLGLAGLLGFRRRETDIR